MTTQTNNTNRLSSPQPSSLISTPTPPPLPTDRPHTRTAAASSVKPKRTLADIIAASLLDRMILNNETFHSFSPLLDRYAADQRTIATAYDQVNKLMNLVIERLVRTDYGTATGSDRQFIETEATTLIKRISDMPQLRFPPPIGVNVCHNVLAQYNGDNQRAVNALKPILWQKVAELTAEFARYTIDAHRNLLNSELGGRVKWHNKQMCTATLRRVELKLEEQKLTNAQKRRYSRQLNVISSPVIEEIQLLDAHTVAVDAFPENRLSEDAKNLIELIPDWLKPAYVIIDGSRVSHRLIRNDNDAETIACQRQPAVRPDPVLAFGRTLVVTIWDENTK